MTKAKNNLNLLIGERLKVIRTENGCSPEDFAELLEISEGHYSALESGLFEFTPHKLLLLYQVLNVDPFYLITGVDTVSACFHVCLTHCTFAQKLLFIQRLLTCMENMVKDSHKSGTH